MSTLLVKVQKIDKIEKHPNADTLSILQIGGWNVIAKTEGIEGHDKALYIPIDAIADKDHPFLGFLEGKRVKTVKLRKIISQGLCIPLPEVVHYLINNLKLDPADAQRLIDTAFEDEGNLAELLGIRKYIPPAAPACFNGDEESANSDFHKYTDIEHYGNYKRALEGKKVWVSEKIHGTSARYALIENNFLVGSRNRQYKHPVEEGRKSSVYSLVFERENLAQKLAHLQNEFPQNKVISIYGEIAGPGVQGKIFRYGQEIPVFFLYDIQVDGRYIDYSDFVRLSTKYEFRTVPILAENINIEDAFPFVEGKSTLDSHIREGIVIKPMNEVFEPRLGRAVLKIISKEYLLKDHEDFKND